MTGESVQFSSAERAALRARAEQARRRARVLAAQTLMLRSEAQQKMRDAATVKAVAEELRDRLMETVNRHARLARALEETPEQTVIRVKEATTEAIAIARDKTGTVDPIEAQALREQIVRWTVDAYFGTIR